MAYGEKSPQRWLARGGAGLPPHEKEIKTRRALALGLLVLRDGGTASLLPSPLTLREPVPFAERFQFVLQP